MLDIRPDFHHHFDASGTSNGTSFNTVKVCNSVNPTQVVFVHSCILATHDAFYVTSNREFQIGRLEKSLVVKSKPV